MWAFVFGCMLSALSFIISVLCEAMDMFEGIKWSVKVSHNEKSSKCWIQSEENSIVFLFDFASLDAN